MMAIKKSTGNALRMSLSKLYHWYFIIIFVTMEGIAQLFTWLSVPQPNILSVRLVDSGLQSWALASLAAVTIVLSFFYVIFTDKLPPYYLLKI